MNKSTSQIGIVEDGGRAGKTNFETYGNNRIDISGCMLLLVDSGYAIISVGFTRRVLKKGMMAILFYDDTFWVEQGSRNFQCRYLSVSYNNIEEAIYKLTSPYFWDSLSENPLLLLNDKQWININAWYNQMVWICHETSKEYTGTMLRNNIYNLFMAIDSEMNQDTKIEKNAISRSRILIIKFLKLISQHCQQTRKVSFYAEQLCITTTYLYKLTQNRWNLSPKELIDQQIIYEIKSLLSNTDMSIKEIAASLHFDDTAYMCHYFRNHTGLSPIQYRNGGKK